MQATHSYNSGKTKKERSVFNFDGYATVPLYVRAE